MKICDITGVKPDVRVFEPSNELPDPRQGLGIEVELERSSPSVLLNIGRSSYWSVKEDESLRLYGIEIVHKFPVFGVDLVKSLDELDSHVYSSDGDILLTSRGSVHVHIDVRGWDTDELLRFVALYQALEPLLFEVYGKGRKNSNFCIPWSDTDFGLIVGGAMKSKAGIKKMLSSSSKYLSLNLQPSFTYGSIEVRLKSSALGEELREWVNIILCITKYIKNNDFDIKELPKMSSTRGFSQLVRDIFGVYSGKFIELDNFLHLVYVGVRSLQDSFNLSYVKTSFNNEFVINQAKKFYVSNRLKPPSIDTTENNKKKELGDFNIFVL